MQVTDDTVRGEQVIQYSETAWNDYLKRPQRIVKFIDHPQANALLNDLDNYPHGLLLAGLMENWFPREEALYMPYRLYCFLGDYPSMWPYRVTPKQFREFLYSIESFDGELLPTSKLLHKLFGLQPKEMWTGIPSSATITFKLLEIDGLSLKSAEAITAILVRGFKIDVSNRYTVDISDDADVTRVFCRLLFYGYRERVSIDQVVYKARELYPTFPGIFDIAMIQLANECCFVTEPGCDECALQRFCVHKSWLNKRFVRTVNIPDSIRKL